MAKTNKLTNIANFLYEVGTLRKIPRSHMQALLTNDLSDNIASHSFRVAIIGWFLAKEEKADPYKVMFMCLFHDIPETRSGDQNWIHKKYVKVFENEIINDQYKNLANGKELLEIVKEYHERKTLESKLAKAADLLDQIMLLKEYERQGNSEAASWLKGSQQEKKVKQLNSIFANKLAKEIMTQKPHGWWQNIWTADRR